MKYYCIGIKGTGMSTLAQILHDLGHEVSGYDDAVGYKFTQKGLEERGIPIYYDQTHPIDKDTIVTLNMFRSIGVSGTHGKTTTSSIIKHILEETIGCNYFIGAGDGFASAKNDYFVVESDEFNRHFTAYHPMYSIITNIEEEHMECYKDIEDIRNTFQIFANQTARLVVLNGDNQEIRKLEINPKKIYFGFNFNNDAVIKNLKLTEDGSRFDLFINEELYGSFEVPLYGKHMVLNTCAAILICREIEIPKEKIYENLKTFKNTIIIDDYAHHPSEIKATLEACKQKYPEKRIVAVFKPNTYSRTKDFTEDFISALKIADRVLLTEIDCNREKQEDYPGITSHIITDKIEGAEIIDEDHIDLLDNEEDSVICFMSCAYVDKLINKLKERRIEQAKKDE